MKSSTISPAQSSATTLRRLADEGYDGEAWHGANLRTALAAVSAETAFWRPGPGRHNIAELALHHAWCVRGAVAQILQEDGGAFPVDGADWFKLTAEWPLSWNDILATVAEQQAALRAAIDRYEAGTAAAARSSAENADLVLGVTCHGIYHAGQVQLIGVLHQAQTGVGS
ncbi:MAG: DinB family protein [Gemmatimonadota bacterium]